MSNDPFMRDVQTGEGIARKIAGARATDAERIAAARARFLVGEESEDEKHHPICRYDWKNKE